MTHPVLIERITRSLAYMLRHQPEKFDVEVDAFGWADLEEVIRALNERLGESVVEEDVLEAVESGDRVRYEVDAGRIRALYGHSIEIEPGDAARPPEHLFLAVPARDVERAKRFGLRGGRRRFVHLALSEEDACEAGRRIAHEYTVLRILALEAWEEGVNFYDRKSLFLAEEVPTHLLEVGETYHDGDPQIPGREDERRREPRRGRSSHGEERGERFRQPERHAADEEEDAGVEDEPRDVEEHEEHDEHDELGEQGEHEDEVGDEGDEGDEGDLEPAGEAGPDQGAPAREPERGGWREPAAAGAGDSGPRRRRRGRRGRRGGAGREERGRDDAPAPRGDDRDAVRPFEPRGDREGRERPRVREEVGSGAERSPAGGRGEAGFGGERRREEPPFGGERRRDEGEDRGRRERGSRDEPPRRDDRGARDEAPRRDDRGGRDERPRRDDRGSRDDRPRGDDRGGRDERPRGDDRGARDDRPRRDERGGRDDRPRRDERGGRDDRPRRDDRGGRDDRSRQRPERGREAPARPREGVLASERGREPERSPSSPGPSFGAGLTGESQRKAASPPPPPPPPPPPATPRAPEPRKPEPEPPARPKGGSPGFGAGL